MGESVYPYLEIECSSAYDLFIQSKFEEVQHLKRTWKAKEMLYAQCELSTYFKEKSGVAVGGGANHIWFHGVKEDRTIDGQRLAIIYFDPYL